MQIDREARVKEAISKLEKETRDRQNEEAQKAREIEDLKKEKKEREKAEREAMEEVKRLRKERSDREKRERAQKEEIQKLKNDKGRSWRVCMSGSGGGQSPLHVSYRLNLFLRRYCAKRAGEKRGTEES